MDRRLLRLNASHVQLAQERNRRYMTLSMRMFSTRTNLNGVAVTERFIDKIVEHAQDYVSMPLCADVRSIERGELRYLGHMYDENTGLFEAEEIGSYVAFMKVIDEDGTVALNGTARVNRRNPKVVEAIKELYAEGNLNFSFEIEAGSFEELPDGTLLIDAADDNDLMAMAVVSTPAYPEAKAISLVASKHGAEKEEETEGDQMNKNKVTVEDGSLTISAEEITMETAEAEAEPVVVEAEAVEAEAAEAEVIEAEAETAEAEVVEAEAETAETVEAEAVEAEAEVAETVEAEAETVEAEAEQADCHEDDERRAEEAETAEADPVAAEMVPVEMTVEYVEVPENPQERHIEEMERELEELRRFRDEEMRRREEEEMERMRREAEARKALLFDFAEAVGLSIMDERVAAAIECLDYETLVLEVANKARAEKQAVVVSSRIDVDIKLDGMYGGMFDRVKSN